MSKAPSVLQLNRLHFSYEDTLVLKDISFQIEEGEFVGIIGPNGGGKTTLLKLILGFLRPNSGEIFVFGKEAGKSSCTIAYVPQSARFDKQFPISVLELVLQGRLAHLPWYGQFSKKDTAAALVAIEQVGLMDHRKKAFGSLSGGQAQRALIARALASHPQLLLLDEPTASVDQEAAAEIYSILKTLQGKITIVMVTHHLQAAVELVDKVICVEQTARVIEPRQICEHFTLGLYHGPLLVLKKHGRAS